MSKRLMLSAARFAAFFPRLIKPALLGATLTLSACSSTPVRQGEEGSSSVRPLCAPCPSCQACPAASSQTPGQTPGETAPPAKPLQAADWSDLPGWQDDRLDAAWSAFLQSCKVLPGKAQNEAWKAPCAAASSLKVVKNGGNGGSGTASPGSNNPNPDSASASIRRFFEQYFRPWQVVNPDGSTQGLITGYYEPLLHGSRKRSAGNPYAIYTPPADLLTIDLGDQYPQLKSMRLRGRLEGNKVVPYWSRKEFGEKESALKLNAIAWVSDPLELFFLQVQGSGRVQLPDGEIMRIGYADQNGHPYRSIGRVLVDRGELTVEEASLQGIYAWALAHPDKVNELLNSNPSYVFFKEVVLKKGQKAGDGPQGALGVPLEAGRSLAVDPRSIPLGAPVFLSTDEPLNNQPVRRLMLAQDTGGAIKGAVRADLFWGFGTEAAMLAGKMRQNGQMWVLLPKTMTPP